MLACSLGGGAARAECRADVADTGTQRWVPCWRGGECMSHAKGGGHNPREGAFTFHEEC